MVMLVLFVLTFKWFREREQRLEEVATRYQKIAELEEALQRLDDSPYFAFQPQNKRYELEVPVQFEQWEYAIPRPYHKKLIKAGKQLQDLLEERQGSSIGNVASELDIKYLVIVEGMAARDPQDVRLNQDRSFIERTYNLSYQRALALANLWRENGIVLDSNQVELIISGSGIFGADRYQGQQQEGRNRRFLIQIIPKTGQLDE